MEILACHDCTCDPILAGCMMDQRTAEAGHPTCFQEVPTSLSASLEPPSMGLPSLEPPSLGLPSLEPSSMGLPDLEPPSTGLPSLWSPHRLNTIADFIGSHWTPLGRQRIEWLSNKKVMQWSIDARAYGVSVSESSAILAGSSTFQAGSGPVLAVSSQAETFAIIPTPLLARPPGAASGHAPASCLDHAPERTLKTGSALEISATMETGSALNTGSGLEIGTAMEIDSTLGLTFGLDCSVGLKPEEPCDCGYRPVAGYYLELPSQEPLSMKLSSQIQAELLAKSQAESLEFPHRHGPS